MPSAIDITGERYGKLVALRRTEKRTKSGCSFWLFECDCGNQKEISLNSVRSGLVKSCGCLERPHGETRTRLHRIWCDMRYRCENPKSDRQNLYCNKGISVCEEWHDYIKFRAWALDNGYADNLTIDRINGNGNYCPENCRWVTQKEQSNNTSANRNVTMFGRTKTVSEWCEILNISSATVYRRIRYYQMPIELALTIPPIKRNNPIIRQWLIDHLKQDCESLGIEVEPDERIKSLLEAWDGKKQV